MRPAEVLLPLLIVGALAQTQQASAQRDSFNPRLDITSRAVLVDVVVTDSSGKPVTGLTRDAFTVKEQGKTQTISFFEEHGTEPSARPAEIPKLPLNVFTNFSPFSEPEAVNVILLDSLNTRMEDQSYAHSQVMKFLSTAKPGKRSAIFTMGFALKFIQGFTEDPGVLAAALNNKKNIEVEPAAALKSQAEADAESRLAAMMSAGRASQESISSMRDFLHENDGARAIDRMWITLANLQQLALFLKGFPGRKNVIWFSERVPTVFLIENNQLYEGNPAIEDEIKKTTAMLGAARAALYPVDPRGVWAGGSETFKEYTSDQTSAQLLAEQSGGRAFSSDNGLSEVLEKVTSDGGHFYTLSYSLRNTPMDGSFRKIDVKIVSGKYKLLYRRGYYAVDADLPSNTLEEKVQKLTAQDQFATDPLAPFMKLGMPQNRQIVYKVRVLPATKPEGAIADKNDKERYKVDFDIDLKDLYLNPGSDGLHKGTVNLSLIVYDRYGNVISRVDRIDDLSINADEYKDLQGLSVQLHARVAVPKGNYWLRTGICDQGSHKVGTVEIPLSAIKTSETGAE